GECVSSLIACPDGQTCIDGGCCEPQCDDKACGSDGCGGTCGTCEEGLICVDQGQCQTPPACAVGEPCEDGDPCTTDDACIEGLCIGVTLDCGDDDPCTDTGCDEDGCFQKPTVCDDDNACTDDGCNDSGCFFKPKNCTDNMPCTDDSCSDGQCEHVVAAGSCLIEGHCVAAGVAPVGEACFVCDPGESDVQWSPTPGASCTPDDPCSPTGTCTAAGCVPDTPCECDVTADCGEFEICLEHSCTTTFCGNGVCDDGEQATCPDDCEACAQAFWCNGACDSPSFGEALCPSDCCGDGVCQSAETAECCFSDCDPTQACSEATPVMTVPTTITGDNSESASLVSGESEACESSTGLGILNTTLGAGPEDLVAFKAPFTGTFVFELTTDFGAQLWFFTDCAHAAETCVSSAGYDILKGGMTVELPLNAGDTLFIAVDASSNFFGAGPYTLVIDGVCTPACGDAVCGDDGCGGDCGTCAADEFCQDGGCEGKPEPTLCESYC
ncbi:MAG: hypothetical protein QF464_17395, partial [Myxococcota bacterium]|nr:hypothetical protein [Myxococcota bacterium]